MANTHTQGGVLPDGGKLLKSYESADNAEVTVSTPTDRKRARYLIAVLVHYSNTVTKNVTVTLNAAAGAAFDTLLDTIAVTAKDGKYFPTNPLPLAADDAIDVVVPASGTGGVTGAATIITVER